MAAERASLPCDAGTSQRLLRAFLGPRLKPHAISAETLDSAAAFLERCADELILREIERSLAQVELEAAVKAANDE
jgi:hypothetical protein